MLSNAAQSLQFDTPCDQAGIAGNFELAVGNSAVPLQHFVRNLTRGLQHSTNGILTVVDKMLNLGRFQCLHVSCLSLYCMKL